MNIRRIFIYEISNNILNSLFSFKIKSDGELYENEIKFVALYHEINLEIKKENSE